MLQTIDRALTIYGNMSPEEQHVFLQAGLVPLSDKSLELSKKCNDIMIDACNMYQAMKKSRFADLLAQDSTSDMNMLLMYPPEEHTNQIGKTLGHVQTECEKLYEPYSTIILAKKIPIFLSAMLYFIYGKLEPTGTEEIYPIIKQCCGGVNIPEIHRSKRPTTSDDVMRLVKTETLKTISTETNAETKTRWCTIS
jgi:hypothetical protein